MIYDRPYMRSERERREISVLTWILALTIGGYVIESILRELFTVDIVRYGALSIPGLQAGYFWTPFTYALLHHPNPLHIVVNLLFVYFLGREVLQLIGSQRFVWLYVGAVALGGIAWLPIVYFQDTGAPLVGCSTAAAALLTVFACFQPNRPVTLLLFFIIPVTVRPKFVLYAAVGASVFLMLVFEITGKSVVAHSAHLGGMLAGWLYFRFVHHRTGDLGSLRPSMELPAWLRRKKKVVPETSYKVDIGPSVDIKAEVDRILDKINSQGFGSLTEEERRVLDSARDVLNKR